MDGFEKIVLLAAAVCMVAFGIHGGYDLHVKSQEYENKISKQDALVSYEYKDVGKNAEVQ